MTREECKALQPGAIVNVRWPGSNAGRDRKMCRVVRPNGGGTMVAVNVARTRPDGTYSNEWGKSVRWFAAEDVLEELPF